MNFKNLLLYIGLIVGFGAVIYSVMHLGNDHSSLKLVNHFTKSDNSAWSQFIETYKN